MDLVEVKVNFGDVTIDRKSTANGLLKLYCSNLLTLLPNTHFDGYILMCFKTYASISRNLLYRPKYDPSIVCRGSNAMFICLPSRSSII
jgi:hypothetical protein